MSEATLKLTLDPPIALLELDHGKANEMGRAQLDELDALVDRLAADDRLRALITFSRRRSRKGTPIFIAGANVTERQGWSPGEVASHVRYQRRVLARLRRLTLFHVAVVNGVALGWGTEFMITCDYRIAAPEASFGLPETGLGILPGAGGSSELWALIGLPQALRLGMTGERISAEEALRVGLIQERADSVDAGLERARALAARVARNSPTAVAAFKAAALGSVGLSPLARSELEARAYEHCLDAGEAAIGRAHFSEIRSGGEVPWGPRKPFQE
ncbi:MAG: enoyl-CoA hydratase/isomerase family protein [Alphaproteobacteria bacterium]|nr:enoyl-CoA hydratase/isomerase family protein [Alphaproteobacteria bacterium]